MELKKKSYGKKEFSLSPSYVQSEDDARDLMSWIINKSAKYKSNN